HGFRRANETQRDRCRCLAPRLMASGPIKSQSSFGVYVFPAMTEKKDWLLQESRTKFQMTNPSPDRAPLLIRFRRVGFRRLRRRGPPKHLVPLQDRPRFHP